MAEHPDVRIGNAEREEAVQALDVHFRAGRLDADDFEDRRGKALDARTRTDLAALFTDLPTKDALGQPLRPAVVAKSDPPSSTGVQVAKAAMGLAPFVALALFFLTDSWLWFLLIPALGVVYGVVRNED